MFVRAYALQNARIAHGSNTIWRDGSLSEKGVLTQVSQLEKGMAVFLCKAWTEKDKSNKYYGDPEGNMSHIGLVVSVNPLRIIDASYSAGKVRETKVMKTVGWNRWGKLKAVDYTGTTEETEEKKNVGYRVTGGTLNVRKAPAKSATRLGQLPNGTDVEVLTNMGTWCKISYKNGIGYVMTQYLEEVTSDA